MAFFFLAPSVPNRVSSGMIIVNAGEALFWFQNDTMNKFVFSLLVFVFTAAMANAQIDPKRKPEEQIRRYWFVMLTKGENRAQDSATAAKLQEGHLTNINRLYNEGKIKVAGPFGGGGDWLGLFIFDCATQHEVDSLLKTDPAIGAGRVNYNIKPWYTAPIGSFVPGKPAVKY
jgi:uncharacterized protein